MLKKIIIASTVASLLLLTGCSMNQSGVNNPEDAIIETHQLSDLDEGAYIQKGDENVFIDFMAEGKAYQQISTDGTNANKIVWIANQDNKIPEFTDADRFILKSETNIPDTPIIHPMEDYGYSIGCTLYKDTASNTWALSNDSSRALCEGSSFNQNFSDGGNSKSSRLFDIGGKKITEDNVSTIGSITGLDKDKEYPIGIYNGTVYTEITAVCDTHIFVDSYQTPYVASMYQYTKDGYIVVETPKDMPSGYYYFDEVGLFKYTKIEGTVTP